MKTIKYGNTYFVEKLSPPNYIELITRTDYVFIYCGSKAVKIKY